ncbi:MAG: hypothetical protein KDC07_07780 [Chitinophagaceae bacterium]|nr:hypothetical protein [Chitinophagaceae bacterium]MCB9044531.1 hypothetical protein [Chitinophagales bacterium]
MTLRSLTAIALLLSATGLHAQEGGKIKESNAHIGFIYPLSTNWVDAINYKNRFSLHAIAGVSAGEEGFCASGTANIIRYDGNGAVLAGSCNVILDNAKGFQAAGFANFIKNEAIGMQAAGFANITGRGRGLQAGGFANINTGKYRGVQLGGFMNLSKKIEGFQAAGFLNVADKVTGTQAAGFGNVAGDVNGVQLSGYFNKAGNVHSQASGFLNIAKNVKGVQVSGFMNIADSCDFPIGLINISRKGEKFLGVTFDDYYTTMVTFRSGGKYLYGIVGAGANFSYADPVYALEAGMGGHIPVAKHFRFNLELSTISLSDFWNSVQVDNSFRVMPALKLGERLEIFAGPVFHYTFSDDLQYFNARTNYLWSRSQPGYYQSMHIGGLAGLHFDI